MSPDEAREFVRRHHRAILATRRADGSPQQSPVLAAVDAEGRIVISTRGATAKAHNLRRHPRGWLCVTTDAFFGPWVQVEGPVEVVEQPDSLEPLVDYYRRTAGEHPDWDDYRAAMQREGRVLLRLTIERAVS